MAREDVEEFTSEDVGFRLACEKDGVSLFSDPVEFENEIALQPLSLLAVGNSRGIYAASNTKSVGVGRLRDLDEGADALAGFHSVLLEDITYLRFDASNEKLYAVSGADLHVADVADLLQGSQTAFTKRNEGVVVVEPSPTQNTTIAYLTVDGTLVAESNGSTASTSGVVSFCWDVSGSHLCIAQNSQFKVLNTKCEEVLSFSDLEAGTLSAIAAVDVNSWLLVGNTPEEEDPLHTLVLKKGSELSSLGVPLAPPFGDVERAQVFYSANLTNWVDGKTYTFMTSALSTEISTLESGDQPQLITQINDVDRAELPMDDDSGDDTLPVGFAIDITGTDVVVPEPCMGVDEAKGVLPRILCLNNSGNLLIWHVFHVRGLQNNTLSLQRVAETRSTPTFGASSAQSIAADNAAPKPAFGGLGFGQSTTTAPSLGVKPAFGSLGFGQSTSTAPSLEAKPAFGGLGFGQSTTSAPSLESKPAFGGLGFGQSTKAPSLETKPAFGSLGFGQSVTTTPALGFGGKPLGFGSVATTTPAAPAPTAESSKLSFGTTGFASNKSAFGSSGFGQSAKSSNQVTSSFGNYTSTSSGFGSIGSDASPFGASKAGNIFGGSSDTSLPFGAVTGSIFGSSSNDQGSIFGSAPAKTEPSPFASMMKKPAEDKPEIVLPDEDLEPSSSPGMVEEEDGDIALTSQSDEKASKSPFDMFKLGDLPSLDNSPSVKSPMDETSESLENSSSADKPLPFGAFKPLTFGAFKQESSADSQPSSAVDPVTDESEYESTDESASEVEEVREAIPSTLNFSGLNLEKPSLPAKPAQSFSFGQPKTPFPAETQPRSIDPVVVAEPVISQPSSNLFGVPPKQVEKNEPQVVLDATPEETPDILSSEGEYEDDVAIFSKIPSIQFEPLHVFAGFSVDYKHPDHEVAKKFTELAQDTEANMKILGMNASVVKKLINDCSFNDVVLQQLELLLPHLWTLGVLEDLIALTQDNQAVTKDLLLLATEQDTRLLELLVSLNESEVNRANFDRLLSQIAVYKNTITSATQKKRPLDIHAAILRLRLRKKLANVKALHGEVLKKMIPYGLQKDLDSGIVSRLEQVVYEVNAKAKQYLEDIEVLEREIHNVQKNQTYITDSDTTVACSPEHKWNLAKAIPKNISVLKINARQIK